MELKLYHYWRSGASWRVRLGLAYKGLSYESIPVNLLESEEKRAEYKQLNPSTYVPCLLVDGKPLGESLAILEWLEECFPKPSILPGDALQRAEVRRFAETINSGIQPLLNLDIVKRVSDDKTKQMEWGRHWIERGLGICEKILEEKQVKGSAYCFGHSFSLADICLIPQCYSALRHEMELEVFPRVHAVYTAAKSMKAFQESCPERFQPTA